MHTWTTKYMDRRSVHDAKARTQADSHWCDSQSPHTGWQSLMWQPKPAHAGWQSLIAVRGRLQLHAALDSSVVESLPVSVPGRLRHSLWTVGTELGAAPPLSAEHLGLFLSSSITKFACRCHFYQKLNTCEKDGHRAWHRLMQIGKTDFAKYRLSNE